MAVRRIRRLRHRLIRIHQIRGIIIIGEEVEDVVEMLEESRLVVGGAGAVQLEGISLNNLSRQMVVVVVDAHP